MKKLFCLMFSVLFLLVCLLPAFAAQDNALVIADNGITDYRIVISAAATATENTAAETLADYLTEISSAAFEIVTDAAAPSEREIVVGATSRDAAVQIERSGMDADAVRILTNGKTLFLTGGGERGTLYAVYTFLEDWLGCRWFTHELTVVPKQQTVRIPEIDYFYEPCFKLRQTYWIFSTMYPDYCAAHKLHGVMAYLPENMGGGRYEMAVSGVHTLQQFITPQMFETNPEYFGCDESGARSPYRQPCLQNEEVFRLAVNRAKNYFSGEHVILSVSQNDGMDFCRCDKCKAFIAAHGNTDAAAVLDFVNRVAAEVQKDYLDARLETLAYQNSQTPPTGLSVAENVVIRLCPISACPLHALDDPKCPANARLSADLAGWAALTDQIYIWDYSTNFQYYYALYPNITSLQARYQYYKANNVVSVFDHGCGEVLVSGELHELRTYLVCKLLWDPDTDIERHISEFCAAYYGEAAEDVIAFVKDYESAVKGFNVKTAKQCHASCQDGGVGIVNNTSLTSADVKRLDARLAQAKARTLSEAEARRLQGLELSWRFTKCAIRAGEFNWYSGLTDPVTATNELVSDMKAYGITILSENWGLALDDRTPDAALLPTFWYKDRAELSTGMRLETQFRELFHRVLYVICTPLRLLRGA